MIRAFLAGAAFALLSACATTPPPDPSVMRAAQSRHYEVPPQRVIAAAREVFRLSDPDDVSFAEEAHGFTANRRVVTVLAPTMTHQWRFEATAADGGTDAFVSESSVMVSTVSSPDDTIAYDVFWNRVDYLLGRGTTWRTCNTVPAGFSRNALCELADDKQPSGPLP